jgi:hypothetical protein
MGCSLIIIFDAPHDRELRIILRSFAGDETGTPIFNAKNPDGIKGTWVEYGFFDKNKIGKLSDYRLVGNGGNDEKINSID